MNRRGLLILMTFTEAFSTSLVGRGIFFYTDWSLHFSAAANLWLAALYGAAYVTAALASHPARSRTRAWDRGIDRGDPDRVNRVIMRG